MALVRLGHETRRRDPVAGMWQQPLPRTAEQHSIARKREGGQKITDSSVKLRVSDVDTSPCVTTSGLVNAQVEQFPVQLTIRSKKEKGGNTSFPIWSGRARATMLPFLPQSLTGDAVLEITPARATRPIGRKRGHGRCKCRVPSSAGLAGAGTPRQIKAYHWLIKPATLDVSWPAANAGAASASAVRYGYGVLLRHAPGAGHRARVICDWGKGRCWHIRYPLLWMIRTPVGWFGGWSSAGSKWCTGPSDHVASSSHWSST